MDTETLEGPPITLQFYSKEASRITGCIFLEKRSAVKTFLSQLGKLKPGRYRMYGHNLEFDMLSILWEVRAKIRDGNICFKIGDWEINGRYSKPVFAVFTDGKRYIEVIDSMLWFMTSLDNAAERVCPDLPKLIRPAGLGTTLYKKSDKGFVAYAMRDAEVAYFLGLAIEKFHREMGIPSQISLASMAATAFKMRYMRDNIYQPPLYQWMVGAAAAYHGGINRIRPNSAPAWHKNVTALDFSSAYPAAMHLFPAFNNANGYKPYKSRVSVRKVPELGCYKITGSAERCDWPALFDHNFKPLVGKFKDIWVSGYETNMAITSGEISIKNISGYCYDDSKDGDYSPFREFVDTHYRMKSEAKDPVMRYMHKIFINALTGKFIQTSDDFTLVDGQLVKIRRAGGLYHPFIAGCITGHTRSVIHPVEHKYKAIHTATDGVIVPGHHKGAVKKELGALVSEGHGDLALFRCKLYIFYTDQESEDTFPSEVFAGRHILKVARHGFQGTVANLERMLVGDQRTYKTNKPLKLKTALRKGEAPNKFVITERTVRNIGEFSVFTHGKPTR